MPLTLGRATVVAVTVIVPGRRAVTTPIPLTVATSLSDEVHST